MSRTKFNVEIKLMSVGFIPTWQVQGEKTKHTVLGQSYIDAEVLPKNIQDKLLSIIKKAYLEHLKNKVVMEV